MNQLKMQSPWVTYYEKIRELFREDDEIKMTFNDDTITLTLYVDNPNKAAALQKYLPTYRQFGNVKMTIDIIPSNSRGFEVTNDVTMENLFEGNPLFHYTRCFDKIFMTDRITYVVFAKKVIQFFNDDLSDLFGNANYLAEDIARDIFGNIEGIFFCTDVVDD